MPCRVNDGSTPICVTAACPTIAPPGSVSRLVTASAVPTSSPLTKAPTVRPGSSSLLIRPGRRADRGGNPIMAVRNTFAAAMRSSSLSRIFRSMVMSTSCLVAACPRQATVNPRERDGLNPCRTQLAPRRSENLASAQMAPRFFWFLPTTGDSRSIVGGSHASANRELPSGYRAPSRRYLAEVARAADRLGFEGVLTPTGTWCEDAWLTSAALLAETERLKFLVAFRPGLVPPTLAAQQTATLQRFSEGRVLLNIVSGGDDSEQRRFGDWLTHDARYARTGEFLHIVNSVWRQESLDFEGKFYTVADARVSAPPDPLPEIYFGGSSPAALPIAAEHVDVYLTWGEPPQAAAAKIAKVRERAHARGRTVRFGIRLHTISRDTSAAAWAVANELVAELSEEQISKATALHSSSESEGHRR